MKKFSAKICIFIVVLAFFCCVLTGTACDCSSGNLDNYEIILSGGKRQFSLGESFDSTGLTVTVKEGSATTELGENDYEVDSSSFDGDTEGVYQIIVRVVKNGKTKTYCVSVSEDGGTWSGDLWL